MLKQGHFFCSLLHLNSEEVLSWSLPLYVFLRLRWFADWLKVWIHGAILYAMTELHRVSTPKFVACNIAAVESRPTSATLRATNYFVYPPSAAFRAIVWRKFHCSANQISHSNLTADLIFACGTFSHKKMVGSAEEESSLVHYSDVSCLQTLTSFLDMRTLVVGKKPRFRESK